MRMDGTVALDMGRAPGASAGAIALAGDLCVAAVEATGLLRHGARGRWSAGSSPRCGGRSSRRW